MFGKPSMSVRQAAEEDKGVSYLTVRSLSLENAEIPFRIRFRSIMKAQIVSSI